MSPTTTFLLPCFYFFSCDAKTVLFFLKRYRILNNFNLILLNNLKIGRFWLLYVSSFVKKTINLLC